jgi:hypothetical protein
MFVTFSMYVQNGEIYNIQTSTQIFQWKTPTSPAPNEGM